MYIIYYSPPTSYGIVSPPGLLFALLALGLLGHAFVRGQETIQYKDPYSTSDYNYTPVQSIPQDALSQYGAHFKHAFTNADTVQERVTDDPLTMSLLTVSKI